MEAKFSRTRRGNALLVDPHGFTYVMNLKKSKRIYWVCSKHRNNAKCRGSAITEGFYIITSSGPEGCVHPPIPWSDLTLDDSVTETVDARGDSELI